MKPATIGSLSAKVLALLYLTTFAPTAVEKFSSPQTPQWFLTQFTPTILNVFPGALAISFYGIAVIEATISVLMLISLFARGPVGQNKVFLFGLLLSEFLFVLLAFGQRLSHQYDGASQLFVAAFFSFFALQLFKLKLV